MQVYRRTVSNNGTINFMPAARAAALVAADEADRKAKAENPTDNASVTPTLERMDLKEVDLETDYFEHLERGTGAVKVSVFKPEQPEVKEVIAAQPAAAPNMDASQISEIVKATLAGVNAAMKAEQVEDAKKETRGRKPKETVTPSADPDATNTGDADNQEDGKPADQTDNAGATV